MATYEAKRVGDEAYINEKIKLARQKAIAKAHGGGRGFGANFSTSSVSAAIGNIMGDVAGSGTPQPNTRKKKASSSQYSEPDFDKPFF
ncbi:MAG: hypothetical protein ACYC7D_04540 [Nitrososphaerales archaeon]